MARRDNAPPVHPGRAPGKAGRIDAAPPDQSGAVPRHTGTPRSRTSACRGPRPRHRVASRSRSRRHTLGAMPCRRRRRRDGAPRRWSCERPESSGETPELAMGRLDAAGLRPGRPDMPALSHVRHRHESTDRPGAPVARAGSEHGQREEGEEGRYPGDEAAPEVRHHRGWGREERTYLGGLCRCGWQSGRERPEPGRTVARHARWVRDREPVT